jgi:phage recombination protein Bet
MSDQALAVREQAIAPLTFNESQLQLIKDTYAKGTTNEEFALFIQTAQYRRLDPFKRQICLISFKDSKLGREVHQPVVTIDGQRAKAEDTGLYEGQTKPEWCGPDGQWVDVWLKADPPAAARVGVYRTGFREALYAVATLASYAAKYPDGNFKAMWKTMPDVMLAKCAEALALRKAFPDQLSGIYTPEEMEQANNQTPAQNGGARMSQPTATTTASSPQEQALNDALLAHCVKIKKGEKAGQAYYDAMYAKKSFAEKQSAALDLKLDVAMPAPENFVEGEIVEPETETASV